MKEEVLNEGLNEEVKTELVGKEQVAEDPPRSGGGTGLPAGEK